MQRPHRVSAIVWPTLEQELLLRACLLEGGACRDAWEQWKSRVDFDSLDQGLHPLLPQLFFNLRAQGVEDPLMGRLGGVFRMTWYKNQLAFRKIEEILRCFQAAGISTLLLEGAALTLLYYRDFGLRPLSGFDLLVHQRDIPLAIPLLERLNWRHKHDKVASALEFELVIRRSASFIDGQEGSFNLHASIGYKYWECRLPDPWKEAVPLRLNEIQTLALSPVEQLIRLCVQGMAGNRVEPLRWIIDAATLLKAVPDLDWMRVVSRAQESRLALPVYAAVRDLHHLSVEIPAPVLPALKNTPISPDERFRFSVAAHRPSLLGNMLAHHDQYARLRQQTDKPVSLGGFLGYLQQFWGVDHLWQVPLYAVLKARRFFPGGARRSPPDFTG